MTLRAHEWPQYYVLVGTTPMAVDMMSWAIALEARHRADVDPWKVARNEINKRCEVSTVFLGLDHGFPLSIEPGAREGYEPVLFESMIFGGPLDGEQARYRTWDEAARGHAAMVEVAQKACVQVGAIRRAARGSKGWRRHVRRQKAGLLQ